jgi:DNA-binding SARP family transcriptional activator
MVVPERARNVGPLLSFTLRLFGSPELIAPDGKPLTGRAGHRHRLALLALLSRSPDGVGRDVLMAFLWPESDLDQARNLLKTSVYVLRQALGDSAIVTTGDNLRLDAGVVASDVVAFEEALARGDLEAAVALHRAPFMQGFFLPDSAEFAHWVDRERARQEDAYAGALETLAEGALKRGDLTAAAEHWKARAAHDPYDSRVALRLMEALAASGNRAAAIRHAGIHGRLLAEDLGMEMPTELEAWVEKIRAEPAPPAALVHEVAQTFAEPPDAEASSLSGAGEADRAAPTTVVTTGSRRWAWLTALAVAAVALLRPWMRGDGSGPDSPEGFAGTSTASAPVTGGLGGGGQAQLATTSLPAWELYRRASQPEVFRSDSVAREALTMVREAVELDPTFGGAYARMALLYLRVGPPEAPAMRAADRYSVAREQARRAIELNDDLAEAHAAAGLAEMYLYGFAEAEEHLLRAIELDPTGGSAREWIAQLYLWMGRFDQALGQAEGALAVDPLSPSALAEVGRVLMVSGRCGEALARLAPLADLDPPLLRVGAILAQCHGRAGRWEEAVAAVEGIVSSGGSYAEAQFGHFLARSGRTEEANAILERLIDKSERAGGDAFHVAMVYAGLGHVDETFQWLERSVDDYSLNFSIREPYFEALRGDPRFERVLQRVGLEGS